MGQAVVWYTGQFYALFFLTQILKVDRYTANLLIAWSLVLRHRLLRRVRRTVRQDRPQADHPARLPDRSADLFPDLPDDHQQRQSGAGKGDRSDRSKSSPIPRIAAFQFNPIGTAKFSTPCDIAKAGAGRRLGELCERSRRRLARGEGQDRRQGIALYRRDDRQPGSSTAASHGRRDIPRQAMPDQRCRIQVDICRQSWRWSGCCSSW